MNIEGEATEERAPRKRGFATLPPERQRELARKGGQSAHAKGTARHFTSEEARAAGKKGGATISARLGAEGMAKLGSLGGKARARAWKLRDGETS